MQALTGGLQNYAWGSTTLLANLRGEGSSPQPEAEIWYGAHPGTATLCDDGTPLLTCIETSPLEYLGQPNLDRFGPKLPFLLKLLAAGSPLSIQAHPSIAQARVGFAAEEAAGVDLRDPTRSFKDDNHKPELICALTEFEALVGFREPSDTADFYSSIGFDGVSGPLESEGPKGVAAGVLDPVSKWNMTTTEIAALVEQLVRAAADYAGPKWAPECALLGRLSKNYAGDPGIIVASLLNFTTLQPGEALYLGAGNMHAYISGLGVELMANSDNVLRGGLTPKHIDVANLLDVVLPDSLTPELVQVTPDGRYLTPAPEFELRRLDVPSAPTIEGPCIVLCTEGALTVSQDDEVIDLQPTGACWLSAGEQAVVAGEANVAWLATVGSGTD